MMDKPQKLYKYRKFDVRTLNMLTDHGLYYSDPGQFNDPLDCDLSIVPDISLAKLANLLKEIMGPDRHDEWKFDVSSFNHYATEDGGDIKKPDPEQNYFHRQVCSSIDREIGDEFNKRGVLSFSETWKSVLMWSHYADEHRGVCLEFDTTELDHPELNKVNYLGNRGVLASDVYAWKMEKDEEAGIRAYDTHFFSKAPGWEYEREWRDIGKEPGPCGDYRITGVYFGYKCDYAVQVAIVKMLGVDTNVDLWDVWIDRNNYELHRRKVDKGEVDAMGMREPRSIEAAHIARMFADLDAMQQEEEQQEQ